MSKGSGLTKIDGFTFFRIQRLSSPKGVAYLSQRFFGLFTFGQPSAECRNSLRQMRNEKLGVIHV